MGSGEWGVGSGQWAVGAQGGGGGGGGSRQGAGGSEQEPVNAPRPTPHSPFYLLTPPTAIPSTKAFCAAKKRMITGSTVTSEAAMR